VAQMVELFRQPGKAIGGDERFAHLLSSFSNRQPALVNSESRRAGRSEQSGVEPISWV
jgi:hypothetical protein